MKDNNQIITTFRNFLSLNDVYHYNDIPAILKKVRPYFRFSHKNKRLKYFNVPCGFDIETTSFSSQLEKGEDYRAIMYEWTFGIFGVILIGRTWEEFEWMINELAKELNLNNEKRLLVYVHNLSFEFQWMRLHFNWEKVFAIDNRKPIYALTDKGIEFRCSYLLSGYSLENLAKNLTEYDLNKKTGDLNYNLTRHSATPLTEKEITYCVFDVKIVMAYIQTEIEKNHGIAYIPLTKTGYVRRFVKNECFKNPDYRKFINGLTLEVEEYQQLKRAFQGGFTHCNPFFAGKVVENVSSFDFTSSYPAVMLSEQFPISKGEKIVIKDKRDLLKNFKSYCCLFDIEFDELESKVFYDSYISESRCTHKSCVVSNNGRIVSAKHIRTTITEQDYLIILKFYTWKKARIYNFRRYKKGYLPKEFINAILTLYEKKTTLKDVETKIAEYLVSKEMLNSCYGMCVTDIVRVEYQYAGNIWYDNSETLDYQKEIDKYNNNKGRFLYFCWGVWVTAFARKNLFSGIVEFNEDYIYSDTDSIKVRNMEKHKNYIERYNKAIIEKIYKTLDLYNIPHERATPLTVEGEIKPLGVWDYEGTYYRFKSLGAKRYMVENKKGINITVSGLNKKTVVPYICRGWYYDVKTKKEHNSPFDKFTDGLYVPSGYTGKMTHRYIDDPKTGVIVDYMGNSYAYNERSSIHLENSDYSLSLSREYSDFLRTLK